MAVIDHTPRKPVDQPIAPFSDGQQHGSAVGDSRTVDQARPSGVCPRGRGREQSVVHRVVVQPKRLRGLESLYVNSFYYAEDAYFCTNPETFVNYSA
jgi:hypothetical protein